MSTKQAYAHAWWPRWNSTLRTCAWQGTARVHVNKLLTSWTWALFPLRFVWPPIKRSKTVSCGLCTERRTGCKFLHTNHSEIDRRFQWSAIHSCSLNTFVSLSVVRSSVAFHKEKTIKFTNACNQLRICIRATRSAVNYSSECVRKTPVNWLLRL